MDKNTPQQGNMQFKYIITGKCIAGFFSIMADHSLLYSTQGGNFSVLLGGDWRFELNVDGNTGRCINFQGTMIGDIQEKDMEIPSHHKGDVFLYRKDKFLIGSGCQYPFIEDHAYYDSIHKILCVGNPYSNGTAIEFADKTVAVICNNTLIAMYLDLKDACKK